MVSNILKRASFLGSLVGVAVLFLTFAQPARAQYPYIVVSSAVTFNVSSNTVSGTSSTAMDYNTQYWYQAYVEGHLKRNGTEVSSNSAYSGSSASSIAVNTQASGTSNQTYLEEGRHGVLPRYANQFGCSFSSYDAYGYSYLICDTTTSCFDYRNTYTSGQTVYAPYWTICWSGNPGGSGGPIRIGKTNTSLQTPTFSITLTNQRVSGSLNGTTQNALLASPAGIQASVAPAGLPGTFSWVLTGPFTVDFSSQDNSYKSIFWTQPGTKVVTVTYAGASATVTVEVRVPVLTSFQGNLGTNVVDRGSNCSQMFSGQFPYGTTYTLGCYQGSQKVGMTWTATASIPSGQYISDLSDAGIQFLQIVSVFRKRMNNGRLECFTTRSPQSDPNTGWNLDFSDPYRTEVPTFVSGSTVTAPYPIPPEFDAPGLALSGQTNGNGTPFAFDSVLVDDRFETYVFYFTGSPGAPSFVRPLHIADAACAADRFDCVDRLLWNWGGTVNFDSSVPNVQYRQTTSTTASGPITATRTFSPRAYDPTPIQRFPYSLCEGAPNTTNPIDGTRFFVQQLYLGILARGADQTGWDNWTSAITQCNVNSSCIFGEAGRRVWVVRQFLFSSETIARFPGLANPPGSPNFDPNVYNPAFVTACYVGLLNRNPDQQGLANWVNTLNQTGNYDHVVNGFLESTEFRTRFGLVDPRY